MLGVGGFFERHYGTRDPLSREILETDALTVALAGHFLVPEGEILKMLNTHHSRRKLTAQLHTERVVIEEPDGESIEVARTILTVFGPDDFQLECIVHEDDERGCSLEIPVRNPASSGQNDMRVVHLPVTDPAFTNIVHHAA